MTVGDDAQATPLSVTVEKDAGAAPQSYRILFGSENGTRSLRVIGADTARARLAVSTLPRGFAEGSRPHAAHRAARHQVQPPARPAPAKLHELALARIKSRAPLSNSQWKVFGFPMSMATTGGLALTWRRGMGRRFFAVDAITQGKYGIAHGRVWLCPSQSANVRLCHARCFQHCCPSWRRHRRGCHTRGGAGAADVGGKGGWPAV